MLLVMNREQKTWNILVKIDIKQVLKCQNFREESNWDVTSVLMTFLSDERAW